MDAIALEDLDGTIVHLDREIDGQLALGVLQDFVQAGIESQPFGGYFKLFEGGDVGVGGYRDRASADGVPNRNRNAHGFLLESRSAR
jgi:hypothetical protein